MVTNGGNHDNLSQQGRADVANTNFRVPSCPGDERANGLLASKRTWQMDHEPHQAAILFPESVPVKCAAPCSTCGPVGGGVQNGSWMRLAGSR